MAVVVNDRDLQLEATVPRAAGVTLGPNVTIDPANVTGLGLVILASKAVVLSATSQFFQVAKTGVVSPSATIVTATIKNLVNTPTLTILPGSGTMSITPSFTLGVFSFTESQMTSETVTLVLTVVEDGVTYTDAMTFVKIREGSDAVNALLTNESVILPADYLGNVTNYSGAAGNFRVYQGVNDVTTVSTFSLAPGGNPQGLVYSLNTTGPTAGAYGVSGGFPSSAFVATLTLRATFGTTVIDKTFTISKSVSGAPGPRGSLNFYVALSGTAAVWDDSLATAAATVGGGPIILDTVTESNNSESYSETRFWTGSSWAVVTAVVNGNLLVDGTVGASAIVTHSLTATQVAAGTLTATEIAAATITGDKVAANTLTADLIDSRGLDIRATDGTVIFSAGHALDFSNIANSLSSTISINAVTGAGFRAGTVTWTSAGAWVSGYGVAMTPGGISAWDSAGTLKFSLDATTGNAYFAGTLAVGTATASSVTGSATATYVEKTSGSDPDTAIDSGIVTLVSGFVSTGKPVQVSITVNTKVKTHTHVNVYCYLVATLDGSEISVASGFNPTWQQDSDAAWIVAPAEIQNWGVSNNMHWTFEVTPAAGSHNYGCKAYVVFYDSTGTPYPISGSSITVEGMAVVREFRA